MVSEDVAPSQQFTAGSRIAGYLLEEQIGQGGMAVVFRAHDERLDRTVALKILAPGREQDQAFRQRFVRESRAAAAVDDPHIIPVFEAGETNGVLFIAMRFVRGGDVRSLVDRVGPLQPGQAADIISPVASALDAAHDAGLVHRDVKPANMLLDRRTGRPDHVYLSDFGLTKGALLATGLTETGQFLGTLDYTAPEQIAGKHVDGRADQYALACAAFELLSGEPPFRRAEAMAVMYAQLSEPPPRLTSSRPELPAVVDAVFARALAKDPAARFGTCREFSEALRGALGISSYDSGPSITPPVAWPPTELAGRSTGPTDHGAGAGYAADRSVRATQVDDRTDLRPSGPGRTGPAPARRSRRVALVLAGAGIAIAAIAAVIVAVTGTGTGHGPGRPHPSTPQHVRHYSLLRTLPGPAGNAVIEGIAFSPAGGTTAAVADNNGGVYLWDAAAGNSARTIAGPGAYGSAALAVAFSPDGSELAAAFKNGEIVLWRVATGGRIGIVTDPSTGVRGAQAVAFSPDGAMLASGDSNGTTYLWNLADLQTGQPAGSLSDENPGSQGVQAVAFSPAGTLASGDSNGTTYVWDLSSRQASRLPDPGAGSLGIQALAFSPDGRLLATADYAGRAIVWNVAARTSVTFTVPGSAGYGAVAVAISHDGAALAVGNGNGTTYLWNLATRRAAGTLPDENGRGVQAVAFSRDGNLLATGDVNGTTYVWQAG